MTRKERAADAFAEVEIELIAISRWMYENPEVAFEEVESSLRLAGFLADNGFDVSYPAYGLRTAFAALAYNNVSTLRQQFEQGDRVHGIIERGGVAPNVIPAITKSS